MLCVKKIGSKILMNKLRKIKTKLEIKKPVKMLQIITFYFTDQWKRTQNN